MANTTHQKDLNWIINDIGDISNNNPSQFSVKYYYEDMRCLYSNINSPQDGNDPISTITQFANGGSLKEVSRSIDKFKESLINPTKETAYSNSAIKFIYQNNSLTAPPQITLYTGPSDSLNETSFYSSNIYITRQVHKCMKITGSYSNSTSKILEIIIEHNQSSNLLAPSSNYNKLYICILVSYSKTEKKHSALSSLFESIITKSIKTNNNQLDIDNMKTGTNIEMNLNTLLFQNTSTIDKNIFFGIDTLGKKPNIILLYKKIIPIKSSNFLKVHSFIMNGIPNSLETIVGSSLVMSPDKNTPVINVPFELNSNVHSINTFTGMVLKEGYVTLSDKNPETSDMQIDTTTTQEIVNDGISKQTLTCVPVDVGGPSYLSSVGLNSSDPKNDNKNQENQKLVEIAKMFTYIIVFSILTTISILGFPFVWGKILEKDNYIFLVCRILTFIILLVSIILLIIGTTSKDNDALLWVGLVLSGLILPGYLWLLMISKIPKYKDWFNKLTDFTGEKYPNNLWILPIPSNNE